MRSRARQPFVRTNRLAPILFYLLLSLLLSPACSPKINSFSVWPRRACPDDTIQVSFDVKGKPRLTVTSKGGGNPDTITYTLIVERHGKTKFARQDVIRFTSGEEKPLVFMTAPLGADSLIAADTLGRGDWNSGATLGTVASRSGRSIRLSHAGRAAWLSGEGIPSTSFSGVPLSGPWELRAPLLPGETLGDPAHSPPDRLRLLTTLRCSPGGGTQ